MGLDSAGNLYVAGGYDGKIHRIAPDGSKTTMDSGFAYPKHLAVYSDGTMYVVANQGTSIVRITPEGRKASLVDLGETISGMATDGEYLYVSHSDKISKIDTFGQVTHIATDLDQPSSLTVCNGNIFVTVRDGIVKTKISDAPTSAPTPVPTPTGIKKCVGNLPYLYVEDRVMGTGKTVEIPVMMCNAKDFANMDIDWSYDAAVLKIIEVTKGSLNKKALFDWNEVSQGKLKTSFASSKGVTGSGSIAVMKFEVIGNPGATSTITGTVTTASKTDGSKISVGVNPGKFTVGASPVKGDCDGDGKLTVKDALAALQMSVEKRAVDMCYDYNDDGKVNSADARDMLKAIVGK
jgi:hypothetical protein